MQSTSEIIKNKQQLLTAEETNKTTAVQLGLNKLTAVPNKEIDYLIQEYSDLTSGGKSMDGWYATQIRRVGVDKFCRLAGIARQDGKNPARYFSWLLKNEVGNA